MSFVALIVKNLIRQRTRTLLTVLGISIGITTVVALGVIAAGLKQTSAELVRAGGSDFMVAQKGTADLTFSTISEDDWAALAARQDVERAYGVLVHASQLGSNPFFLLFGVRPEQLTEVPPPLQQGALLTPGETDTILLGDRAASDLKAGVGDTVEIKQRTLRVAGIYHTGNTFEDGGGYTPLAVAQELAGKPGTVTAVYISARDDSGVDALADAIREQFPNLTTVQDVSDYSEVDQGMLLIDSANLAISLLAVGIGAIGVMNTMIMSVFERTRQIGILRAVGWSSGRILRMVIGESLVLCLIAAVVGTALGILASRAVLLVPAVSSFLEPRYSPEIFLRALIVAGAVALIGAVYPAIRAVRLTPMEALRYE